LLSMRLSQKVVLIKIAGKAIRRQAILSYLPTSRQLLTFETAKG